MREVETDQPLAPRPRLRPDIPWYASYNPGLKCINPRVEIDVVTCPSWDFPTRLSVWA